MTGHKMAASEDAVLRAVSSGLKSAKYETASPEGNYHSQHAATGCFNTGKNKGGIVVLLWIICGLFVMHALFPYTLIQEMKNSKYFYVIFVLCFLLYPLLGYLGDVRFGRYAMVKWSLRALWLVSIIFCLSSALLQYFNPKYEDWIRHADEILMYSVYAPIFICLGGFITNVFPLMNDQLADANSDEIILFIHWIVWAWFLACILSVLSQLCVCIEYKPIGYLLAPLFLSFAIVVDSNFNHKVIKEPVSESPIVLIVKVVWYAARHKYPQQRIAYWDDRHTSRVDLAKCTFGGPFTTEQVEDVKSFFRIWGVVVAGSFFCSIYMTVFPQFVNVLSHLHDGHFTSNLDRCESAYEKDCFERIAVHYLGQIAMVLGLPLFKVALSPVFKRYKYVRILWKTSFGLFALLLSIAACAIIELIAHMKSSNFSTSSCPFDSNFTLESQPSSLQLDYKWMIIPFFIGSIGQYLTLVSFSEFLSAQSPYSMRGFLFGVSFSTLAVFAILGYFLMKPIQKLSVRLMPGHHYGCLFWYFLFSLGILIIISCVYFVMFKCYKKRYRQDINQTEN